MPTQPTHPNLSDTDKRIIALLQSKADMPMQELAIRVSLSKTACWNRLQNLYRSGVIRQKQLLLDATKLGYAIKALLLIKTNQHSQHWLQQFHQHIQAMPRVISYYRLTGEVDYVLEVVAIDMQEYNQIYNQLVQGCSIYSVSTAIVMEEAHKPLPIE